MKYLLDTNICIYIIKKKPDKVINKFREHKVGDIAISSITVAELNYGIAKSSKPYENTIALKEFIQPLEIIDFSQEDSEAYGEIRATLENKGVPIGAMDLLIASQAINRNLILVTNNENEFKRVKRIRIENWSK
ncbi:MAG: type II toxin-antitoxin system VapC family toxin [Ignavibacteriales bacterium]|nr:MAG: type II toxin-antitoxin system VapC family toxin [Ignavibacteriales bacterium]